MSAPDPTAAAAAAQHLHLVSHDLGRPAIVAIPVLPFAGTQLALDIDLRSLAQVFRGDLGQAVEHCHLVPLGALLLLAGLLVFPLLAGRDAQIGDRAAARHVARVRILAEIADQYDFVDSAGHQGPLLVWVGWRADERSLVAFEGELL